jgi:nicotinamide-nucleotide amidase
MAVRRVSALDTRIAALVARLAEVLVAMPASMAAAESCTGGLIAAACTSRAGSSAWFERGVVTYSNAAKTELLGVAAELIAAHGAVSAEVACAMAEGVVARTPARFAIAVTGIAGPDGGTPAKPVGTVWIATCARDDAIAHPTLLQASGDRAEVRAQSVERALALLLARVEAATRGLG